ncbi:MAG: ABC transporter permease [Huintestinicola sp.]|uniref:ABC transporter permease n=1 Tax=Huintestinicola sp. TaxID=2981661 RepID=UPI003F0B1630
MFERMMAKRYITTQKRHSVLTVCSIAAALALMTMLFTCFSTFMNIIRDACYDDKPYHMELRKLDDEQVRIVSDYVGDMGKLEIIEENGTKTVRIMFTEYIGEVMEGDPSYSYKLAERLEGDFELNVNSVLVMFDMVDLNSRANMAVLFSMFYIVVLFFIIMLRMVIDTAFEISSKERERQFGVLQSIGAAPGQIVKIITLEGLMLSAVGVPAGMIIGTGLGYAAYRAVLSAGIADLYLTSEKAAQLVHFHIEPLYMVIAAVTGLLWVLLSAYGTGMRVIRMSPIRAISNRSNTVKKVKRFSLFGTVFGWKGKMASRNNLRQPKRFIITVLSLTFSIVLFAGISTVTDIFEKSFGEIMTEGFGEEDLQVHYVNNTDTNTTYRSGMEKLESCGYFSNVSTNISRSGSARTENDKEKYMADVVYYDRISYEKLFDGKPPAAYDELTESGGYALLVPENEYAFADEAQKLSEGDTVTLNMIKNIYVSADEYERLSENERNGIRAVRDHMNENNEPLYYIRYENQNNDFYIKTVGTSEKTYAELDRDDIYSYTESGKYVILAGTLETYDNVENEYYGSAGSFTLYGCEIENSDDYNAALNLINDAPELELLTDAFSVRRQIRTVIATERIAVAFLTGLVTLIAVVNMVNILSTGVLNRRSELASMQCIGMTDGQLYGMTVMECLQYSLSAGLLATVICSLLIYGTEQFMTAMGVTDLVDIRLDYIAPMPKIWLAAAVSFIAALCSSIIPLANMQKKSLVDMIRTVD